MYSIGMEYLQNCFLVSENSLLLFKSENQTPETFASYREELSSSLDDGISPFMNLKIDSSLCLPSITAYFVFPLSSSIDWCKKMGGIGIFFNMLSIRNDCFSSDQTEFLW